jgi:hypothetical protein
MRRKAFAVPDSIGIAPYERRTISASRIAVMARSTGVER